MKKTRFQQGSAILMVIGVLALMLLFAAFAINAVRYYTFKEQLKALAAQIAQYAGTDLPNPRRAYDSAQHAFHALSADLISGAAARFPADLSMQVFLDAKRYGPSQIKEERTPYIGQRDKLALPIKSMTVELKASYDLTFLNFAAISGFASMSVSGSAKTQLTPTDVVLVIENSNSVVSPLELERGERRDQYLPFLTMLDERFGIWNDSFVGTAPEYGTLTAIQSKALMRARQCFGEINISVKKAALFLYDLLAASGTFRVGVIHTLDTGGQFPLATLNIEAKSYENPFDRVLDPPEANLNYGWPEYAETRCALLAVENGLKIPAHPLRDILDAGFYEENFLEIFPDNFFACSGKSGQPKCPPGELQHMQFSSVDKVKLNPRELIWIMNAGGGYENGNLNPRYDFNVMQFALLRAIDMLRNAPKRADNLPVQKRVILVLTDGFEKPFSYPGAYNPDSSLSNNSFRRVKDAVKQGYSFETEDIEYSAAAAQFGTTIFENYCSSEGAAQGFSNLISQITQLAQNEEARMSNNTGIKLGILYHGARSFTSNFDPLSAVRNLPGHQFDSEDLAEFRQACNTNWGFVRGRFLVEASPYTGNGESDWELGHAFFERLAPRVARALLTSEIVE